jgi:hypothetical protein
MKSTATNIYKTSTLSYGFITIIFQFASAKLKKFLFARFYRQEFQKNLKEVKIIEKALDIYMNFSKDYQEQFSK